MSIIYIFLIIFVYYISNLEDEKCLLKMVSMGVIIILLWQNQILEGYESPTPPTPPTPPTSPTPPTPPTPPPPPPNVTNKSNVKESNVKNQTMDDIIDDMVGSDISPTNVSKYDGLCLTNDNKEGWMKYPNNMQLLKDEDLYVTQGHTNPLEPIFSDVSNTHGPSVDGTEDGPKSLFMLKNNISSPLCCPSTFSTSSGCVCTTEKQRNYIRNRGNGSNDLCISD